MFIAPGLAVRRNTQEKLLRSGGSVRGVSISCRQRSEYRTAICYSARNALPNAVLVEVRWLRVCVRRAFKKDFTSTLAALAELRPAGTACASQPDSAGFSGLWPGGIASTFGVGRVPPAPFLA